MIKLEPLELDGIARALADRVKRDIDTQPGDRWNKSGRLRAAIAAHGSQVVVTAADRLGDDEVAQRFADEVLAGAQTNDARVVEAIDRAITEAIEVDGD